MHLSMIHVACNLCHRRAKPLVLYQSEALLQVRKVAEENGVDVSSQIAELESRAKQVSCLESATLPQATAKLLVSLPGLSI